ncbi:MAG: heavy-metal-associated domain-containing protein [Betaproteobacteria bacterium]|nr:heavy-metal-associated domain-containing protein [Betaproteobacteria bacterium]
MEQATLQVGGMTCQGCVRGVTGALERLSGVLRVQVTLEKGTAVVDYDPAKTELLALKAAVEAAGFDVA